MTTRCGFSQEVWTGFPIGFFWIGSDIIGKVLTTGCFIMSLAGFIQKGRVRMIIGFIFLNMDGCGLEDMFTQIFIQTKNQLGIVMMTMVVNLVGLKIWLIIPDSDLEENTLKRGNISILTKKEFH